jgi:hypothetical protein
LNEAEIYAKENLRGIWLITELLQNKDVKISFEDILEQTVYLTSIENKIHNNNCSYLKYGKKPIKRKEALERGLGTCDECNP